MAEVLNLVTYIKLANLTGHTMYAQSLELTWSFAVWIGSNHRLTLLSSILGAVEVHK